MFRRVVLLVTAIGVCGALRSAPAWADHSPANCRANGLALSIDRDKDTVKNGDVITYGVYVRNDDLPNSCDITNATITLAGPGPDGNPSPNPVTVASGVNLKGGSGQIFVGNVAWSVNVDPTKVKAGQTSLDALGVADGTLHDIDNALHAAHITKTLGTDASPSMTMTKTGSTLGGPSPQTVTYTYTVTNNSAVAAPTTAVKVNDDLCSPVTYVSGDVGSDGVLGNGETWTYTCTKTYTVADCYTNTATSTGTATVGQVVYSLNGGPVTWTACVTAPPPPPAPPQPQPNGGVKAASACVSVASQHLKVRAKEVNTVRVRVRVDGKNIAGSKVRISGPAGLKKTGMTNKRGMVTFVVRPKKSGRLTITSDKCAVKARVSVKPARRVVAPALPEVTG